MKSLLVLIALSIGSCSTNKSDKVVDSAPAKQQNKNVTMQVKTDGMSQAYFASGCFWCVEAIFESVEGVGDVVSGYAGGTAETANYQDVSAGRSDHAEAVLINYDPAKITFETLLKVFFGSQDPTTLNQQGPDRGRQYRSAIFYQNDTELAAAKKAIADLEAAKVYSSKITTTLEPLEKFYAAEAYHQDYEARNPNQPYVRSVSVPRLKRFQKSYPDLLKKDKH